MLVLVFVVGLGMGLAGITEESLWCDEQYSKEYASNESLLELVQQVAQEDKHPPLYYAMLHFWTGAFGSSPLMLRMPSAIAATLAVILLFLAASRRGNRSWGLAGALILAFTPWYVYYAQEARMYALLVALTAGAVLLSFDNSRRSPLLSCLLAGVLGLLLVLTHYYGGVVLATLCIMKSVRYIRSRWPYDLIIGACAAAGGLVGLLLWGPFLLTQVASANAAVHIGSLTAEGVLASFAFPLLPPSPGKLAIIAGLALIGVCFIVAFGRVERKERVRVCFTLYPASVLSLAWVILPVFLIAAASLRVSFWNDSRIIAVTLPGLAMFLGSCVTFAETKTRTVALSVAIGLFLVAGQGIMHTSHQKEEWREAASFITQREQAGDQIVVMTGGVIHRVFRYYYQGARPSAAISRNVVDPAELRYRVGQMWPEEGRLWLVLSHELDNPLPELLCDKWEGPSLVSRREFQGVRVMLFEGDNPLNAP